MRKVLIRFILLAAMYIIVMLKEKDGVTWHYWTTVGLSIALCVNEGA